MSTTRCFRKSNFQIQENFLPRKFIKFLKVAKPVLKLIRKQRTNAVTPSTCNYAVVESVQNDLNESELLHLKFKFLEGNEADENLRNEELEKRLLEKLEDDRGAAHARPVTPFLSDSRNVRGWTSETDIDICKRGDDYVTCRQRAEQQVPVAVI